MKKILNYVAATAALTLMLGACSKALAPAEQSSAPQSAGSVEITISNVTDYSFDVTLTPKGTASYYSYLVDNDEPDDGIEAATLYAVGYQSVAQGTVKYEKGKESYTFSVEADPNTPYTIYAVAGAPDGNVGTINFKSLTTTDELDPSLEEFQFEENMVALIFSEPVQYVEGKKITAVGYAKLYLTGTPVVASAEGEILQNKDGVVIIQFPDFEVPGTYYAVSYPEGTFTDVVGNPAPALTTTFTAPLKQDEDGEWPEPETNEGGVYGYLENVPFEFNLKDAPASISSENIANYIPFNSEQMLAKAFPKKATVSIVHTSEGKTVTEEYALSGAPAYGAISLYALGVKIPADASPVGGDQITIALDEGIAMDIYGNLSAAKDTTILYSYVVSDAYGTYQNNGESGYGPVYDEEPWTFTITATDDEEKGNVKITEWYGFDELEIYGDFNTDTGVFTMPIFFEYLGGFLTYVDQARTIIGLVEYYTFAYFSCSQKEQNDLKLLMSEPGKFTEGNDFPGYYYEVYKWPDSNNPADIDEDADYLGSDYNIFDPVFTRIEVTGSEPGTGGTSVKSLGKINGKTDYRFYHQPRFTVNPAKELVKQK